MQPGALVALVVIDCDLFSENYSLLFSNLKVLKAL